MSTGRAKTVIVFGQGNAFLTEIIVRTRGRAGRTRIHWPGSAQFTPAVKKHVRRIILPLIDRILAALSLPLPSFEISAVNLGAASAQDLGVSISGFSADCPIFLAVLAAALQLDIPPDIVTTGHIASADGDIRQVKDLPAKIKAASDSFQIRRFIYPSLRIDSSPDMLSPKEHERDWMVVTQPRDSLRVQAVSDVAELTRAIFTEEVLLLSSLRQGFYAPLQISETGDILVRLLAYLANDNERRFWSVLEEVLFAGRGEEGRCLLSARLRYHLKRQEYPKELGNRLMLLLQSLPPTIKRLKLQAPLMDLNEVLCFEHLAHPSDQDDLNVLCEIAQDKVNHDFDPSMEEAATTLYAAETVLDAILSEINQTALGRRIGIPLDTARATFVMDTAKVNSYEKFLSIIRAFYLHIMRHYGVLQASGVSNMELDAALGLLEGSYKNEGGVKGAYAQAQHGGLRQLLDAMVNHYKREQTEKYVEAVLHQAVDSLSRNGRIDLIKVIKNRLALILPLEIRSQTPEQMEEHCKEMILTYVELAERIQHHLRCI